MSAETTHLQTLAKTAKDHGFDATINEAKGHIEIKVPAYNSKTEYVVEIAKTTNEVLCVLNY